MFESVWLMLGVSRWWRRLTTSLSSAVNWVGQSALHVVLASLLCAIALNLWQWHDHDALVAHNARQMARWQTALAAEQAAFRAEQQATATLRAAEANQTASMERLASVGNARVAAAKAGFSAAVTRDARMNALATRISHEADRHKNDAPCRTPDTVMAAKDIL